MIPRDVAGIPILGLGVVMGVLPAAVADVLALPIIRSTVGDIEQVGLKRLPYGPNAQVREHGRIPLLDIGTMALIRTGKIVVRPGIERFTNDGVRFLDGTQAAYRVVVLATGYRQQVSDLLAGMDGICTAQGAPLVSGRQAAEGPYFCGFCVSPQGMLREIASEARQIAASIARSTADA